MRNLQTLQSITKEGLNLLKKEKGLIDGVVYASSNERVVGRLVYTSHLPSNGLEEPKSDMDYGVSVEIWFEENGRKLLGMGHEPNDLSLDGVKRAIAKARRDAVEDKDFTGFLKKIDLPKQKKTSTEKHAEIDISPEDEAELLAKISWETIEGAVDTVKDYAKKQKKTPKELAFILNGDNFIVKERMSLATIGGISDSEESIVILSTLTAMLERDDAKGSSWGAVYGLGKDFSAYDIGRQAALSAINCVGSKRMKSGKYKVIFGQQAVTELFGTLLSPHVNLSFIEFGASLFTGKYGQQIASPLLTMYDDATLKKGAGSKRITDEGYPTGKTRLIEKGKLVGYLSDSKTVGKMLKIREEATEKIGVDPHTIKEALIPRNGFRYAKGGGRVASSGVGVYATNLIIDSEQSVTPNDLLKSVEDGIFIGKLWYTYPVGGYSSGIISGTAIADCYTIKNGKLADPIKPNSLRIEDNLAEMIHRIIGIGNNHRPTALWLSDEITHAPWVAMDLVQFFAINEENA